MLYLNPALLQKKGRMMEKPLIRKAVSDDAMAILEFGNAIPELKVSAEADFMTRAEVLAAVNNPRGIFLLAESEGVLLGLGYANAKDIDRPPLETHACLVYLAVSPNMRGSGLGHELYQRLIDDLKTLGVTYLYAWANPTSGVIQFMERRSWAKGHPCVWMDISL